MKSGISSEFSDLFEMFLILGLPSFEEIPELLKLVGLEDTGNGEFRAYLRKVFGIYQLVAPEFK